ncbi:hypothetical protein DFH28DRAFT_923133 [Melampsora americana]|nr:hypothetical protein DFH28DRAFT_923133 [Melampsora americana]
MGAIKEGKKRTEEKDSRETGKKQLAGLVASPGAKTAQIQDPPAQETRRPDPNPSPEQAAAIVAIIEVEIKVVELECRVPTEANNQRTERPTGIRTPREVERTIPSSRRMAHKGDPGQDNTLKGREKDNKSVDGDVLENGITFVSNKVPSHHMIQLTVFWNNRVHKRIDRKLTADEDEDSEEEENKGLKHPNELRLTYGDWVTTFNLMLDYVRDWYGYKTLAKNFQKHKEIVEAIKEENDENWMVALRYDIPVRRQIWTTRVEGGGVRDPSVRQRKVKEKARRTMDKCNKWDFHDEPYAKGGPKQNNVPVLTKIGSTSMKARSTTHHSTNGARVEAEIDAKEDVAVATCSTQTGTTGTTATTNTFVKRGTNHSTAGKATLPIGIAGLLTRTPISHQGSKMTAPGLQDKNPTDRTRRERRVTDQRIQTPNTGGSEWEKLTYHV